jgi:hypothetical protein
MPQHAAHTEITVRRNWSNEPAERPNEPDGTVLVRRGDRPWRHRCGLRKLEGCTH